MVTFRPRVFLVGAGGYGRVYLDALTKEDLGADLVGICDMQADLPERIPLLRERHIPVYPTLEAFYAADHADLAILASPVHFHAEMAISCFAHGSHVLCEKPLCLTVKEARAMAEGAARAGRFLSVGYQLDYRRDVLALKNDILSGRFGAPIRLGILHGYRRGADYYRRNDWAGRIAVNGREVWDSPFSNASAHNFQMMAFLLGNALHTACGITGVQAELYRGNPLVENFDIAALRFSTDCGAELMYFTAHPIEPDELGPRGILEFEKGTITLGPEHPSFRARMRDGTCVDYARIDPGPPLQKLVDALNAVRNGTAPVCGVEADLPHITAVCMVQQQPVLPVRDSLRISYALKGTPYVRIDGIEALFEQCLTKWALPMELGKGLA